MSPDAQITSPTGHRAAAPATRGHAALAILRVTSGNFLEMYDFMIYAYYAVYIGHAFFPSHDPFASLMAALATFGAGFLMRPVGAVVLGAYIDRYGRRRGLILTLALMGLALLIIAVTPSFAEIGILAPIIVVFGRLLQGFSAGVELGGVSVYLAEIAPPGRWGFFCSWQSGSQQLAVAFAAVLGLVLASSLTPAEMQGWGWRIPLFVGCAIVPLLLLLRRSLEETPDFATRKEHPGFGAIFRSLPAHAGIVLIGTMLVAMTTVTFYFLTAYTPTFGRTALKLGEVQVMIVTLVVALSNFIWLPIWGAISDRIGRRPVLIGATVAALVTGFPVIFWLVRDISFGHMLIAELWVSLLFGAYNGAAIPFLVELVPAAVRTTSFALAYSLATALFGGFTPAICTLLIHATGDRAAPGAWLSLAALLGLAATLLSQRTRRASPSLQH